MLKTSKCFAGMALRCLAVLLSFLMAGGVMASAQQKNISLKVSNVSIESALTLSRANTESLSSLRLKDLIFRPR